jgi:hypothetical protein
MTLSFFLVRSLTGFSRVPEGPAAAGKGLFVSPAGYFLVVATNEDRWHFHAAKDPRPGVLRIFEASRIVMRLLDEAVRVAQDARHISDHRIDHHHGRDLAAVADEIADGDFPRRQTLADSFVEPFITATQQ